MIRLLAFLAVLFPVLFSQAPAQSLTPALDTIPGRLWGYVDSRGEWVIAPDFVHAMPFREGRALVSSYRENDRLMFGVIDTHGQWLVAPILQSEFPPYDSSGENVSMYTAYGSTRLFPILWHYTDTAGATWSAVMDSTWRITIDSIESVRHRIFLNGLNAARVDGKWGVVGSDGEWAVQPRYDSIGTVQESPFVVLDSSGYHYIGLPGTPSIAGSFEQAFDFYSKRAIVQSGGRFGVIDTLGQWVQPAIYDTIIREFRGYLFAARNGRWSILDSTGSRVADQEFDRMPERHYSDPEPYLSVTNNGLWGALDYRSHWIAPLDSEKPVFRYNVITPGGGSEPQRSAIS